MSLGFEELDFRPFVRCDQSFNLEYPDNRHDAIHLDIDHTPTNILSQTNTRFYTEGGLLPENSGNAVLGS